MPNAAATHASDLDTLQELNRNYIRSVRTSDVRWFDEHLAEDFVNSNPDCSFVDRAGFLAQVARPSAVTNIEAEDVRIRVLGEVAIIHARTTYTKPDGQAGRAATRTSGSVAGDAGSAWPPTSAAAEG